MTLVLYIGPSDADKTADIQTGITGIVFDYIEFPYTSRSIPAGYWLKGDAAMYHVGASFRVTPE